MSYADDTAAAAASLHTKYAELHEQLRHNQFQKPIHIDSSERSGRVTGDIYALIDHPFAQVASSLSKPASWCDILILHLNTKYCRASSAGRGTIIHMHIGRKYDQPLEDTYEAEFAFRVAASSPSYLDVRLDADKGPLSTHDYRIRLEAIPLEDEWTFLHLTYSYAYGLTGQLALQGYLTTLGRNKVGFTVVGKQSDGQPRHVDGTRGAVERNAMRYYLAIEAFLGAMSAPPQERPEKSFRDWFAATERYPRQLHEIEQSDYLAMKRKEYARQQSGRLSPP